MSKIFDDVALWGAKRASSQTENPDSVRFVVSFDGREFIVSPMILCWLKGGVLEDFFVGMSFGHTRAEDCRARKHEGFHAQMPRSDDIH